MTIHCLPSTNKIFNLVATLLAMQSFQAFTFSVPAASIANLILGVENRELPQSKQTSTFEKTKTACLFTFFKPE